jgi:hypothetical protein
VSNIDGMRRMIRTVTGMAEPYGCFLAHSEYSSATMASISSGECGLRITAAFRTTLVGVILLVPDSTSSVPCSRFCPFR